MMHHLYLRSRCVSCIRVETAGERQDSLLKPRLSSVNDPWNSASLGDDGDRRGINMSTMSGGPLQPEGWSWCCFTHACSRQSKGRKGEAGRKILKDIRKASRI
jgi:hypothetical protein